MMRRASAVLLAGALAILSAPAVAQTIGDIRLKADAGDTNSQYLLGEAYRTGQGVQADRDAAIGWFRKAATQGDTRAADALGLLLFTKGERAESITLLFKAAARGDARAQYLLGTAHFNGDGVPRDLPRAYAEMKASAAQYLPQAIRNLELMEPYISADDRAAAAHVKVGTPPLTVATEVPRPKPAPTAAKPVTVPAVPAFAPPPANAPASAGGFVPLQRVDLPPSTAATAPLPPKPITVTEQAPVPASAPSAPVATPRPAIVAKADPAPAPPRPAPAASGKWKVQLGALTTEAGAQGHWKTLLRQVPALGSYNHVIVQAAPTVWRVQATGLADHAAAQGLCKTVTEKGGNCLVMAP